VRLFLAATLASLLPGCGSEEQANPAGFIAVAERHGVELRLEFESPPEFRFVMSIPDESEPGGIETQVHATRRAEGEKVKLYEFNGTRELDEGGNRCVVYEYEAAGRPSYDLIIWTRIESVSPGHLEHMRIDRAPFCIVQLVNPAGIFPVPLNREGAPPEERYRASGPIRFERNGKYGYKDPSNTRVIVEPRFEDAEPFVRGRARVTLDGKQGFLGPDGKFIVEPRFDWCRDYGFLGNPDWAHVEIGGKQAVIDRDGEFAIEPKFDELLDWPSDGTIHVTQGELHGVIDASGRELIPPVYRSIDHFAEGLAAVQTKDRKWGFLGADRSLALPAIHDGARSFSEGLAPVAKKRAPDGEEPRLLWGAIDESGKLVIPYRFKSLGTFSGGTAYAELDGQRGRVNHAGEFTARE